MLATESSESISFSEEEEVLLEEELSDEEELFDEELLDEEDEKLVLDAIDDEGRMSS